MVRDNTERPWREKHRKVAEIGKVNFAVMHCEDARNNQIVGASDQREEAYASGVSARRVQSRKQRRIRSELVAHTRPNPIGPVGSAVGCAQRDAPIDPARAAKLLDVDPGDQSTETVANELDAAAPDVSAKVFPQGQRGLVDSGA